jgi:general secretion pathway protein M
MNQSNAFRRGGDQVRQRVAGVRQQASVFWLARTAQERKFLTVGGVLLLLLLIYALLIDPAITGGAKLRKELPLLRQESAEISALAQQATQLQRQAPPQVPAMTRDSLTAALTARSLTAKSISLTGEYAKLQLNGVPFATLVTWLDALRRESRIGVQDIVVTALATPGQVDATITLRQSAAATS